MKTNVSLLSDVARHLLSPYPTTIRRSVSLPHVIAVDHSVNGWLYKRWQENCLVESELSSLHREMAAQISDHIGNPNIQVEFVHLAPTSYNRNRGHH